MLGTKMRTLLFHRIIAVPRLAGADLPWGEIMASAEVTSDTASQRPNFLRWAGLAVAAGLALFAAARLVQAIRQPANEPTNTQYGISQSHCAQFIALAKAKFGADWKVRLDPRDTTCAQQVQQEWQHDWNARLPVEPMPQSTLIISAPVAPPVDAAPSPTDARLRNPETYCLNVISLARTRYGPDWTHRVTPDEAANCGAAIQRSASQ